MLHISFKEIHSQVYVISNLLVTKLDAQILPDN